MEWTEQRGKPASEKSERATGLRFEVLKLGPCRPSEAMRDRIYVLRTGMTMGILIDFGTELTDGLGKAPWGASTIPLSTIGSIYLYPSRTGHHSDN